MTPWKIGAAPTMPLTFRIGVWSALPTQTATARFGVKPTVRLSRKSFVVPVLAATWWPGITRSLSRPNESERLRSSESICAMMKLT